MGWFGCLSCRLDRRDPEGCRACPCTEGRAKAQGTGTCHGAEVQSQESFGRHRLRADGKNAQAKTLRPGAERSNSLARSNRTTSSSWATRAPAKAPSSEGFCSRFEERGETAIVYDPALDYTPEFYKPERGDAILNPLDQRMPYWSPGDELLHPAEALTLAASLFPDRRNENPFFVEGPRKIFAHLLTFRPTPEEMAWWMCHEEEIDQRVKGTQYAAMINPQAPAQRSGVLASLNMVADSLKLLPSEKEAAGRWSAAAWSKERKGWLFLTSTSETRQRLLPLTSLWLDTLVLRLMNQGQTSSGKVWFVLDELATLQRLPQLHTAVTENRKSNNPVVLGFQGRSQLETRYGHEAEAMLSQPATKIFLRTSEPSRGGVDFANHRRVETRAFE